MSRYQYLQAAITADPALSALSGEPLLVALQARGAIARPLLESELLANLSGPSLLAIADWVNLPLLKADIAAQNLVGVGLWLNLLNAIGRISTEEKNVGFGLLARTIADAGPSVAEGIAGWNLPVTIDDLAAIGKA